ncbi:MAG: glycosyltransferase family 2 protein [bacterium]
MIYFVIPVYNEAARVGRLIEGIAGVCRALGEQYRIIAVDDGSVDGSAEIIEKRPEKENIRLIRFKENRGIGTVIRVGFLNASNSAADDDPIVFIESDGSNDPETIVPMLAKFKAGADVITASRYIDGGSCVGFPPLRSRVSRAANYLLHAGFPLPNTTDYTYFFKMYRASIIKHALKHYGDDLLSCAGFSANSEFFIKTCLFTDQYAQVPTVYTFSRQDSDSKFNPKKEIKDFIFLFRVCRHAIQDYVVINAE